MGAGASSKSTSGEGQNLRPQRKNSLLRFLTKIKQREMTTDEVGKYRERKVDAWVPLDMGGVHVFMIYLLVLYRFFFGGVCYQFP